MSSMQIDNVLAQIRALQSQVKVGASQVAKPGDIAGPGAAGAAQGAAPTSFANVLKQGLDRVNQAQASASDIATKFERGVPGVELSQVMLESQKASVAFRATVEVRNRLVNAYQEIMNMPI
jgi:flagellar hook-basal body complex protein FliE